MLRLSIANDDLIGQFQENIFGFGNAETRSYNQ